LGFLLIARQASASLPGVRWRIPRAARIAVFAMCGSCFHIRALNGLWLFCHSGRSWEAARQPITIVSLPDNMLPAAHISWSA